MNYKKIYITGAPGWLGTRLVETIAKGLPDHPDLTTGIPTEEISVFTLPGTPTAELTKIDTRVRTFSGDVRHKTDTQNWLKDAKGALLIHIAGIIHPKKSREFDEINYLGTKNILTAAEHAGVQRVVIMSSNSPFGTNPHRDHLFDEASPYNPYLGYGLSKKKMEQTAFEFAQHGKMEVVIIRAPWFYGPNQPERQSLFFSMIKSGKVPVVGSGDNRRSMTYIDNLCQGLMLASIRPGISGQAFWIADERPYTMNEIINTIENLLENDFSIQCKRKRMHMPNLASKVAYGIDLALQKAGLYHQKFHVLSEMNKEIACDVSMAKRKLGYQPKYDLRKGMGKSIKWAIDQGHQI